jgi:hypothetical protein
MEILIHSLFFHFLNYQIVYFLEFHCILQSFDKVHFVHSFGSSYQHNIGSFDIVNCFDCLRNLLSCILSFIGNTNYHCIILSSIILVHTPIPHNHPVRFTNSSHTIPCLHINHNYNFITNNPNHNFDSHRMVFGYFGNNLLDFSLGNSFVDLDNNSFDLSLVCFLDECSSDFLPDILAGNFTNCPNKMEERGHC